MYPVKDVGTPPGLAIALAPCVHVLDSLKDVDTFLAAVGERPRVPMRPRSGASNTRTADTVFLCIQAATGSARDASQ